VVFHLYLFFLRVRGPLLPFFRTWHLLRLAARRCTLVLAGAVRDCPAFVVSPGANASASCPPPPLPRDLLPAAPSPAFSHQLSAWGCFPSPFPPSFPFPLLQPTSRQRLPVAPPLNIVEDTPSIAPRGAGRFVWVPFSLSIIHNYPIGVSRRM
jgi:hypothetical protein